ncbi:MAG: nitronate monooxygenase [Desulfobacterales bacterium]|nr:nitronate monooxygenase [Desulfobacterales bacterium]
MEWQTPMTRLLKIRYPVMQGALAVVSDVNLAAAVSEAGGLGMLTAWTQRRPEKLSQAIRELRDRTDRPFAVNLSPTMDQGLLKMLDVIIDEKVPVVETAGDRALAYGKRIKAAGLTWIHKVHTVKHAMTAQKDGADAVCIMGLEGAGLKSPMILTTLVSIAMAAEKITIPVIAAGGIGDARTFLGALALGADGVQLGSAFCLVKESKLPDSRKQVLIKADPYDPKWRGPILASPTAADLQQVQEAEGTKEIMGAAHRAESFGFPQEAGTGTISLAIGFVNRVVTAKELIGEIMAGAGDILTNKGIGGFKLVPGTDSGS